MISLIFSKDYLLIRINAIKHNGFLNIKCSSTYGYLSGRPFFSLIFPAVTVMKKGRLSAEEVLSLVLDASDGETDDESNSDMDILSVDAPHPPGPQAVKVSSPYIHKISTMHIKMLFIKTFNPSTWVLLSAAHVHLQKNHCAHVLISLPPLFPLLLHLPLRKSLNTTEPHQETCSHHLHGSKHSI